MTAKRRTIEHLAPWLGLLGAAVSWGASQQIGSDAVFDDCSARGVGFVVIVGLAGLAVAIAGGWFSWGVWRDEGESNGRRFIGILGVLLAILAAFAMILQSLAALIIPSCAV
jgi:TRAP-type C4-dicarboxylate transport system permease small subunit